MDGITAEKMADILGISYVLVRKRLSKAKIKPISRLAIYPLDALEKIRDAKPVGRPKKQPEPVKKPRKK